MNVYRIYIQEKEGFRMWPRVQDTYTVTCKKIQRGRRGRALLSYCVHRFFASYPRLPERSRLYTTRFVSLSRLPIVHWTFNYSGCSEVGAVPRPSSPGLLEASNRTLKIDRLPEIYAFVMVISYGAGKIHSPFLSLNSIGSCPRCSPLDHQWSTRERERDRERERESTRALPNIFTMSLVHET